MTSPIAIIGAGGWGTALAITLGRAERNVRLWASENYLVETIRATDENPLYLPGARFPRRHVLVTNSMQQALEGAGIVIIAAPSHVFRSVVERMIPHLNREMLYVSAAKGIENATLMRMSEVALIHAIGKQFLPRVAALSGPTFAAEVAAGEPTALVVASPEEDLRLFLQKEL